MKSFQNADPSTFSQKRRRRQPLARNASAVPTSYVAPSSYYRLRNFSRTNSATASLSGDTSFGDRVHSRVIGSRFQELNRDSRLLPAVPYGSIVQLGKAGELEPVHEAIPDPSQYGPNHGEEPSSSHLGPYQTTDNPRQWSHLQNVSDYEMVDIPPSDELTPNEEQGQQGESDGLVRPRPPRANATNVSSSARETFAMRGASEDPSTNPPPHMRLQLQPPFVRPLSGLAHEQLTAIYDDIRHWRSSLKVANKEIADLQNDIYTNIADGNRITGWLLCGRGIRFIPGIKMIEGRSKNDIKWHELQREGNHLSELGFWVTTTMVSALVGALLIAVAALAVAGAPNVSHYLAFFGPLANKSLGAALATTLAPALLGTIFMVAAFAIINCEPSRFQFTQRKSDPFLQMHPGLMDPCRSPMVNSMLSEQRSIFLWSFPLYGLSPSAPSSFPYGHLTSAMQDRHLSPTGAFTWRHFYWSSSSTWQLLPQLF